MSFRTRFVLTVLTLALVPVGIGGWAVADREAASEEAQADTALKAMVRAAEGELRQILAAAQRRAERLAALPAVQLALQNRDGRALERLARRHLNVQFVADSSLSAGDARAPSVQRSVEVISGERSLGYVVVFVPLDRELVQRLRRAAGAPGEDVLALARGGRLLVGAGQRLTLPAERPGEIRLAGKEYRAIAGRALAGGTGLRLVMLTPRAPLDEAVSDLRLEVVVGGAGVLAALGLLAYLLAPAVARGRVSLEQRAQAARVLSNVGDGIVLVDRAGVVRLWNPAAEAITGVAAEEVVGRGLVEAMPAWETIERLVPVAQRPAEGERPPAHAVPLEVDGRELWLSLSAVEFEEGVVYDFRDLTEERRLDDLKADFVSTVSHELRTPVAAVYGAAMTLQERGDTLPEETRREMLETLYGQSDRLARLIEDILVAGQLGSGWFGSPDGRFDPSVLAGAVIDEMPAALRDGHPLELRTEESLPAVAGDPAKARQVLANLLQNAIKYSPEEGAIDVAVERHGGFVRFVVRDRGVGIAAAEQKRIFEKFYRVDPDMRHGVGGTGLGLYICRELVQHMRGRIWVSSTPGAGSTFSFELPVA